jgi:hypothetical protein
MRKQFVTSFWQRAYEKMPENVRGQYLTQMQTAERWELFIGELIEFVSRAKNAVVKLFHSPRAKRA